MTQKSLIDEEWSEFHEAFHHEPLDHVLKELADLVYVCYQYAAHEGWDLDEAMNRLHESNLSKLDENGDPIFRADGKVLKGPNYKPPYLGDLALASIRCITAKSSGSLRFKQIDSLPRFSQAKIALCPLAPAS